MSGLAIALVAAIGIALVATIGFVVYKFCTMVVVPSLNAGKVADRAPRWR